MSSPITYHPAMQPLAEAMENERKAYKAWFEYPDIDDEGFRLHSVWQDTVEHRHMIEGEILRQSRAHA